MNQRLVWNFEFSNIKQPTLNYSVMESEPLKWEARYFWPEDCVITLSAIEEGLLDLANYHQKHKEDCYYLIPAYDFNIKLRREELLYKPLVTQSTPLSICGFGHKHSLRDLDASEHASMDDLKTIAELVAKAGIRIPVIKESFTYKMTTEPSIKIELSHLDVFNTVYFSLCIEGKSLALVEQITQSILGEKSSSNYTSFLKSLLKS